jgi:hypothetical protein
MIIMKAAEDIAQDRLLMNTHQDRIVRIDLSHYHCQMHFAIQEVLEGDRPELPMTCRHSG